MVSPKLTALPQRHPGTGNKLIATPKGAQDRFSKVKQTEVQVPRGTVANQVGPVVGGGAGRYAQALQPTPPAGPPAAHLEKETPKEESFFKKLERANPREPDEERRDYRLRIIKLLKDHQKEEKVVKNTTSPKAKPIAPQTTAPSSAPREDPGPKEDSAIDDPYMDGEPLESESASNKKRGRSADKDRHRANKIWSAGAHPGRQEDRGPRRGVHLQEAKKDSSTHKTTLKLTSRKQVQRNSQRAWLKRK